MQKLSLSLFLTLGVSCLSATAQAEDVSSVTIHNDLKEHIYIGKGKGVPSTHVAPGQNASIELKDPDQQQICAVKQEVDCINNEDVQIHTVNIGSIERGAEPQGRVGWPDKPDLTAVTLVRLQPVNYKLNGVDKQELFHSISFGNDGADKINELSTSFVGNIGNKAVYNMGLKKRSGSGAVCEYNSQYPTIQGTYCFEHVDSATLHISVRPVDGKQRKDEL